MYKWLKNGVSLNDFSLELFYKIHNTQRQDAGAYQCIAKNDVGAIFSEKNNIIVACKSIIETVNLMLSPFFIIAKINLSY